MIVNRGQQQLVSELTSCRSGNDATGQFYLRHILQYRVSASLALVTPAAHRQTTIHLRQGDLSGIIPVMKWHKQKFTRTM